MNQKYGLFYPRNSFQFLIYEVLNSYFLKELYLGKEIENGERYCFHYLICRRLLTKREKLSRRNINKKKTNLWKIIGIIWHFITGLSFMRVLIFGITNYNKFYKSTGLMKEYQTNNRSNCFVGTAIRISLRAF